MKLHEYAPYINGRETDNSIPSKYAFLLDACNIASSLPEHVKEEMREAGNPDMYYRSPFTEVDEEIFYRVLSGYTEATMPAKLFHSIQVVGQITGNDFTLLPQLLPESILQGMFNSDFVLHNTSLAVVIRKFFNKIYEPFSATVREVNLPDGRSRVYIIEDGSTFILDKPLNFTLLEYNLLHRIETGDIYVGSKNLLTLIGGGYANESKTIIQGLL